MHWGGKFFIFKKSVGEVVLLLDVQTLLDETGLEAVFTEWIRIFHHPVSTQATHVTHVKGLISRGLVASDGLTCAFVRTCMATCLLQKYGAVDAFARLIVLLLLHVAEPVELMHKVCSVLVLVLVDAHETNGFNPKPHHRLWSALLWDISTFSAQLPHFQLVLAIRFPFCNTATLCTRSLPHSLLNSLLLGLPLYHILTLCRIFLLLRATNIMHV